MVLNRHSNQNWSFVCIKLRAITINKDLLVSDFFFISTVHDRDNIPESIFPMGQSCLVVISSSCLPSILYGSLLAIL